MPALGPTTAQRNQQLIDALWDFADPAASEARFSIAVAEAATDEAATDEAATVDQRAVLRTQIARALGLQSRFDEAHSMLDEISPSTDSARYASAELAVRVDLERGRVLNSSGSPAEARALFEAAFERASAEGLEHLAIDALHMVAIVAAPEEQAALNEQALSIARAASDPRARDWRASLLNNLGWTKFDAGSLAEALALFEEAVAERVRMGKTRELAAARWSVARVLRALGRTEEALGAQIDLVHWMAAAELTDSYVEEEIGECLLDLGRSGEAASHFALAAGLLEKSGPGEEPDPERLTRLRTLAGHSTTTPDPGTA